MGDTSALPSTDRRVSRRTLARGAAWSAPVIVVAAAAPAYATSPVPCEVVNAFDGLVVGQSPNPIKFLPSTITANFSYVNNAGAGDTGATGTVAQTSTTPPWRYIEIEMLSNLVQGENIVVNLTFSAPVTNLTFKLHDIDTVTGQWKDEVIVNTRTGLSYVRGANITGDGTSAAPFTNTTQVDNPISSGLGDVQLKWTGPISAVQFTYRAGITGNSQNQHIGLGAISFSDCVANPNSARRSAQAAVVAGDFTPGPQVALVPGRDN